MSSTAMPNATVKMMPEVTFRSSPNITMMAPIMANGNTLVTKQINTMTPLRNSNPANRATAARARPKPPTMSEAREALFTSTKWAVPVTCHSVPSGMFSSHQASRASLRRAKAWDPTSSTLPRMRTCLPS